MGNPRVVRVLVVMDVKVRPHNWTAKHIEETISSLITAVVSPAPHEAGNLWIDKYKVHTVGNAYDKLLEPWEQESR